MWNFAQMLSWGNVILDSLVWTYGVWRIVLCAEDLMVFYRLLNVEPCKMLLDSAIGNILQ